MKQLFNKLKCVLMKKGEETLPNDTIKEIMISVSNENKYLREEKDAILIRNKKLEQNINVLIDTMIDIKNNSINVLMEDINNEVNTYINFTMVNYGTNSYKFIDLVRAELNSKDEQLVENFVGKVLNIDKIDLHTLFPNLKSLYLTKHQEKRFSLVDKNDMKNILIAFGNGIIPDNSKFCKIVYEQANMNFIEFKKEINES